MNYINMMLQYEGSDFTDIEHYFGTKFNLDKDET